MRYLIVLLVLFSGCSFIDDIINPKPPIIVEPTPTPQPSPEPTPTPTPPVVNPPLQVYIPDNCSNPPKHLSANDGFKCMASSTQGGSIVCLLPHQFTWKPYNQFTDHHGVTMKCSNNRFDTVDLIRKNGTRITLQWDKCQNYVSTSEGKIGRQHWRNKSIKWDNEKNRVATIEMKKGNKKTCLKF